MERDLYREQWQKWQASYEIQAYRLFKRAIEQSYSGLNVGNLTYDNYKLIIPLNVSKEAIQQAYIDVYVNIGLVHGRRVGFGINREVKMFDKDLFGKFFQENIISWIRDNVGQRITSVAETIAKRISRLVEVAAINGLSVDDMQKYLRKRINDPKFTKYQALRIARTEVGGAANHAATVAAETSGIAMEKVWISYKDKRVRMIPHDAFDHVEMDGVVIDQSEKFMLQAKSGAIEYLNTPCDPKGSAGDVINCRCVVAHRPKRDLNGFVIMLSQ